jgi:hypothetical protein
VTEISGQLGTTSHLTIVSHTCFGSRGSSVQIRPRRPFISITYPENPTKLIYPILLSFAPWGYEDFGTDSGHDLDSEISATNSIVAHSKQKTTTTVGTGNLGEGFVKNRSRDC